jgi:hypothetical protein
MTMMRKCELDNHGVFCPNASRLGFSKTTAKRGDLVVWKYPGEDRTFFGRSLGRIKSCDNDGTDCTGHLVIFTPGSNLTFGMIRWVSPDDVVDVCAWPANFLAFLSGEMPVKDPIMVLRMVEYGACADHYVVDAVERIRTTGQVEHTYTDTPKTRK